MAIELQDLRLMECVTDRGSLTAAAPRLGLTPSALSHRLRGLERELQTRLFLRVGKRMVLTESGRRLLSSAERVLPEIRQAARDLARLAGGESGTLRVSTACYTSYHWLPGLLGEFQGRHPGVNVRVLPQFTRRPVEALRQGELDVAVVFGSTAGEDLVIEPFLDDELLVIASPAVAAGRDTFRVEDFADVEVYLYSTDPDVSILLKEVLSPAGIAPRATHAVPLTEALIELVRAGGGVSVLANWAVEPHLGGPSLVAMRLGRRGFRRTWSAIALKDGPWEDHLPELAALLRGAGKARRSARTRREHP